MPRAYSPQDYFPEALKATALYKPGPFGFEKEIAKRIAWWADLRERLEGGGPQRAEPPEDSLGGS